MGEVFLAEDTRLGRQVALKFLATSDGADTEARERLVREAQAASVLRSPHIAVTYDLVEHGDDLFIAMEYVEGELLSARIARGTLRGARGPRDRHAGGRRARRGARRRASCIATSRAPT